MADAIVKDVEINVEGDTVTVISEYKLSDLHGQRDFLTYQMKDNIRDMVIEAMAKSFIEKHGKEIIKDVLTGVNWPEIMRSEIAQRVLREAVRERKSY